MRSTYALVTALVCVTLGSALLVQGQSRVVIPGQEVPVTDNRKTPIDTPPATDNTKKGPGLSQSNRDTPTNNTPDATTGTDDRGTTTGDTDTGTRTGTEPPRDEPPVVVEPPVAEPPQEPEPIDPCAPQAAVVDENDYNSALLGALDAVLPGIAVMPNDWPPSDEPPETEPPVTDPPGADPCPPQDPVPPTDPPEVCAGFDIINHLAQIDGQDVTTEDPWGQITLMGAGSVTVEKRFTIYPAGGIELLDPIHITTLINPKINTELTQVPTGFDVNLWTSESQVPTNLITLRGLRGDAPGLHFVGIEGGALTETIEFSVYFDFMIDPCATNPAIANLPACAVVSGNSMNFLIAEWPVARVPGCPITGRDPKTRNWDSFGSSTLNPFDGFLSMSATSDGSTVPSDFFTLSSSLTSTQQQDDGTWAVTYDHTITNNQNQPLNNMVLYATQATAPFANPRGAGAIVTEIENNQWYTFIDINEPGGTQTISMTYDIGDSDFSSGQLDHRVQAHQLFGAGRKELIRAAERGYLEHFAPDQIAIAQFDASIGTLLPGLTADVQSNVPDRALVPAGGELQLQVLIENATNAPVTDLVIAHDLPNGMQLAKGGQQINEQIDALAIGGTAQFTYDVVIDAFPADGQALCTGQLTTATATRSNKTVQAQRLGGRCFIPEIVGARLAVRPSLVGERELDTLGMQEEFDLCLYANNRSTEAMTGVRPWLELPEGTAIINSGTADTVTGNWAGFPPIAVLPPGAESEPLCVRGQVTADAINLPLNDEYQRVVEYRYGAEANESGGFEIDRRRAKVLRPELSYFGTGLWPTPAEDTQLGDNNEIMYRVRAVNLLPQNGAVTDMVAQLQVSPSLVLSPLRSAQSVTQDSDSMYTIAFDDITDASELELIFTLAETNQTLICAQILSAIGFVEGTDTAVSGPVGVAPKCHTAGNFVPGAVLEVQAAQPGAAIETGDAILLDYTLTNTTAQPIVDSQVQVTPPVGLASNTAQSIIETLEPGGVHTGVLTMTATASGTHCVGQSDLQLQSDTQTQLVLEGAFPLCFTVTEPGAEPDLPANSNASAALSFAAQTGTGVAPGDLFELVLSFTNTADEAIADIGIDIETPALLQAYSGVQAMGVTQTDDGTRVTAAQLEPGESLNRNWYVQVPADVQNGATFELEAFAEYTYKNESTQLTSTLVQVVIGAVVTPAAPSTGELPVFAPAVDSQ